MKFAVRQGQPGDEKALAELDKLCFQQEHWSEESFAKDLRENLLAIYVLAEDPEEEDQVPEEPAHHLDKGEKQLPHRPELYGYVGVWIIAGEGHITNVAVHPQYRRQRIAETLLQLLFDFCEAMDVHDFTLEVRASNAGAIRLYKGCGFQEAGIRPKYYEDNGEDAIIMWRRSEKKE